MKIVKGNVSIDLRTRDGRLRSTFVLKELSLPTPVVHQHILAVIKFGGLSQTGVQCYMNIVPLFALVLLSVVPPIAIALFYTSP